MKPLFLLLLFIPLQVYSHTVFIVIHGNWAIKEHWHMPGGDFFDELENSTHLFNAHIVPYLWTGNNNHVSRLYAAQGLVKLIQSYPIDTHINLITHSHGSNVGIIASQLLAQDVNNQHKIDIFYALGAPVEASYFPDMGIINYFYHLFSFEDLVQPALGLFGRQFPEHERIANIRITIDQQEPGHSGLHHPTVAHWLPHLHQQLIHNQLVFTNPGFVHFYANKSPCYEIDTERTALLERSDAINQLLIQSLLRSHRIVTLFDNTI